VQPHGNHAIKWSNVCNACANTQTEYYTYKYNKRNCSSYLPQVMRLHIKSNTAWLITYIRGTQTTGIKTEEWTNLEAVNLETDANSRSKEKTVSNFWKSGPSQVRNDTEFRRNCTTFAKKEMITISDCPVILHIVFLLPVLSVARHFQPFRSKSWNRQRWVYYRVNQHKLHHQHCEDVLTKLKFKLWMSGNNARS